MCHTEKFAQYQTWYTCISFPCPIQVMLQGSAYRMGHGGQILITTTPVGGPTFQTVLVALSQNLLQTTQ